MKKIMLQEFGVELEQRRAAYEARYGRSANEDMPRNASTRRTASKRALLQAITDTGAKW